MAEGRLSAIWRKLKRRLRGASRSGPNFSTTELVVLVRALKDAGIEFVPVDRFADATRNYYASQAPAPPDAPFGLIKCDLHANMERALNLARALQGAGVHALFLMLHRHRMNREFYDAAPTWQVLGAVRDMGHEVGLHIDPFSLLREHRDLYKGVAAAVDDFGARGFNVRAATFHGDTSPHLRERGIAAREVFREHVRSSSWDKVPPHGEEWLAEHFGRYDFARLASDFGIRYIVERDFWADGSGIAPDAIRYLTDNSRTLRMQMVPRADGSVRDVAATEPFSISPEFVREVVPVLCERPFLALFHAQWFS